MQTIIEKNDVIRFGEAIELEKMGIGTIGWLSIVVGIIVMVYFLLAEELEIGFIFAALMIGVPLILAGISTGDQMDVYEAKMNEWEHEYIIPYIEQMPIERMENIEYKHDYLLEQKGYFPGRKPIQITNKEKEMSMWVKVIEDNKVEKPYIEYKYLDTTFNEEYPSGYYEATLFVKKSEDD